MHDAAEDKPDVRVDFGDVANELSKFFAFISPFDPLHFIYDDDRSVSAFACDIADDVEGIS
jgi:hypothetical protein